MRIRVNRLSETDFAEIREAWNGLLAQSYADRLFLSWEWQYRWWRCWGDLLADDLLLLAATDDQGDLIGLAPLFVSRNRVKKIFPVQRIQFIGNDWRGAGTVRTEYLDFIARKDIHLDVVEAFLGYITENVDFSELVVCDIDTASGTFGFLKDLAGEYGFMCRYSDGDVGNRIRLNGDFREYLSSLGGSTRASLYNQRKHLGARNDTQIRYADEKNFDEYLAVLNRLHEKRWNKALFSDVQLKFHLEICERFAAGGDLRLSVIFAEDRPVSALYDIRQGDSEYYLQSGFDPSFHKKLSLGLIHLGYAIEKAFEDGVTWFDLLVGAGQKTHYKSRLAKSERSVCALQLVKGLKMKSLYYAYDSLNQARRYRDSPA
jgi:CelD/BcsL family acetyltransferase involved in cellulose biosynthesis